MEFALCWIISCQKKVLVSVDHFVNLTKKVSKLFQAKLVHGDIRLQNIVFETGGKETLLDHEWAAKLGTGSFPADVNKEAFVYEAAKHVGQSGNIPVDFDWICFADILTMIGCDMGREAALEQNIDEEIDALKTMETENGATISKTVCSKLQHGLKRPGYLNFGRVSDRVKDYFHAFEQSSGKRKSNDLSSSSHC